MLQAAGSVNCQKHFFNIISSLAGSPLLTKKKTWHDRGFLNNLGGWQLEKNTHISADRHAAWALCIMGVYTKQSAVSIYFCVCL